MIRKEKNGIAWLEFELLQEFKELQHGVILRQGGVSKAPYDSLNLSFKCGDEPLDVERNWQIIRETFQLKQIVKGRLNHGDHIVSLTSQNLSELPYCDALGTQERDLGLLATHADCQAAIFYDPIQKAFAVVHAGWRGSVLNIYEKTIDFLTNQFRSSISDLHVCISPSLGPAEAEFINYRTELPSTFWDFQYTPNYFNFWDISRWQLLEKGILPHHIQIAEIGTVSNPQDYFSYRRSPVTGRQGTFAAKRL